MPADYRTLLPIDGRTFETDKGTWKAKVTDWPDPVGTDQVCYSLEFEAVSTNAKPRCLKLWLSDAALHHDPEAKYKSVVFGLVNQWLLTESNKPELYYFG